MVRGNAPCAATEICTCLRNGSWSASRAAVNNAYFHCFLTKFQTMGETHSRAEATRAFVTVLLVCSSCCLFSSSEISCCGRPNIVCVCGAMCGCVCWYPPNYTSCKCASLVPGQGTAVHFTRSSAGAANPSGRRFFPEATGEKRGWEELRWQERAVRGTRIIQCVVYVVLVLFDC